jgi:hypothetical protein
LYAPLQSPVTLSSYYNTCRVCCIQMTRRWSTNYYLLSSWAGFSSSLKFFKGVNLRRSFSGTSTVPCVFGLRAVYGLERRVLKVPNPEIITGVFDDTAYKSIAKLLFEFTDTATTRQTKDRMERNAAGGVRRGAVPNKVSQ